MRKIIIFGFLFVILGSSIVDADQIRLTEKVTGKPLSYTRIFLDGQPYVTDRFGDIALPLRSGRYQLKVQIQDQWISKQIQLDGDVQSFQEIQISF